MDGTILHFDSAEGAGLIRAGDSKRYSFAAADWKSPGAPSAGQIVDFEVEGDRAVALYLVRSGPLPAPSAATGFGRKPGAAPTPQAQPPSHDPPRPAGGDVKTFLANRAGLPFAAVVLLACFMPFLSISMISPSLFGTVSFFSTVMAFAGDSLGMKLGLWLYYLLYAIPLSAAWLIFQELREQASAGLRAKVGLIGLVGPFAIFIVGGLIVRASLPARMFSGTTSRPRGGGDLGLAIISHFGFGWVLIAIASAALVAVGMGWSPFGRDDPGDRNLS